MTDLTNRPDGLAPGTPPADRPIANRWQVGLRTLFLLICAIAVWLAVVANRRQIALMEARIKSLRPLARELEIDDVDKIAIVKKNDLWMDEDRWDLHLPPGSYRVCVATRKVDLNKLAPVRKSAPIRPGRHRLALDQWNEGEFWRVRLTCDGSELFAIEEPKEFSGNGSSGGSEFSMSEQLAANKPVVLCRRRFMRPSGGGSSQTPSGPADGLLIWIESEGGSKVDP